MGTLPMGKSYEIYDSHVGMRQENHREFGVSLSYTEMWSQQNKTNVRFTLHDILGKGNWKHLGAQRLPVSGERRVGRKSVGTFRAVPLLCVVL